LPDNPAPGCGQTRLPTSSPYRRSVGLRGRLVGPWTRLCDLPVGPHDHPPMGHETPIVLDRKAPGTRRAVRPAAILGLPAGIPRGIHGVVALRPRGSSGLAGTSWGTTASTGPAYPDSPPALMALTR